MTNYRAKFLFAKAQGADIRAICIEFNERVAQLTLKNSWKLQIHPTC
jgi:hypothetical protein